MDLKCGQRGLVLFLFMVLAVHHVDLKSVGRECRQCKPGYYASRLCTESHDTVCKPCPRGTFTPDQNKLKICYPCTKCDAGYFVSKACTLRSDTACKSCSAVNGDVTEQFLRSCRHVQGDDPGETIRLDDLKDVKLDKADAEETRALGTDPDLIAVPEGSGTGIIEETVENQYPIVNATEEVEGSGVDITEGEDKNTTSVSVILPDEGEEDISTTTVTNNVTTSTSKEGTIEIGGGITLENITKGKSDIEPELVNPAPTKQPTTTVINSVELDDSAGIIVEDKTTKKIDYGEDNTEDVIDGGIIDVNIDIDNGEPRAGASHRQEPSQSKGVGTGVVVTVGLLAALVFFILGFVVSRYWSRRQERSFNVLEAERRNGKPPIECSGIEYKDPENNIPAKTNIYGSMPKSKTVNGNTPEGKPQTVRTDKPITKTPAQTTGSQPDKKPDLAGDGEWAGFSLSRNDSSGSLILRPTKPRAESEIRYIDEGSGDEGETDALLPPSSANQSKAGNKQEASLINQNKPENKQEASSTNKNTAENKQETPSSNQNKAGNQQKTSSPSQNTAGNQQETSSPNQSKPENGQEKPSTNQNEQEKPSTNQNKAGDQQKIERAPQPDVVSSAEANNETQVDETTPMISKSSSDNNS